MKQRIILLTLATLLSVASEAQRLQQPLGRGVVAVNRTGGRSVTAAGGQGSLISWRKLAQEPEGTTYNVYRRTKGSENYVKMNGSPLRVTNMQATLSNNTEYAVTAISPDGVEGPLSTPFLYKTQPWPNVWFNFDFDDTVIRRDDYRTKYAWPMDVDGNGEFDAVVVDRLYAGSLGDDEEGGDNTSTTSHKIQAYKLDGTLLWTVDMGPNVNICGGQNDMVLAYDIDCDGRCEVIVRSSDGTRFWDKQNETWGLYVGGRTNADTDGDGIVDYRTQGVRNPPFYISVIDGATGAELACSELKYHELSDGSDSYGRDNRASYMNFGYGAMEGHYGIAYLDGLHPSLIMECEDRDTGGQHHGYVLTWDYDWTDGTPSNWHHSHTWVRNPKRPGCAEFHQIRILDSDGDGCDEMWAGGYGVNPAQDRFTSTGLEHGDRFVISDIDPDRPGLEGFAIQQSSLLGQCLYDARTAERIKEWYLPSLYDVGRGSCLDIDATHKGYEIFSWADEFVYDCKGERTGQTRSGSMFEGVWWDGRLQREWLNSPGGSGVNTNLMVTRVFGDRLVEFSQESNWATHANTGTRPAFMGDITGDWREEVILAKQNSDHSTGLVGYTTNMPTAYSIYCLQQDPHYRLDCTTRGYYQHPNTGFYLGGDMSMPPLPPVFEADMRYKGAGAYVSFDMTRPVDLADGRSILFDIYGDADAPVVLGSAVAPKEVLVMNPRGHDYTFDGPGTFNGPMQLTKSMLGTATFNAGLAHTGPTLVSEGTLVVNGTVAGPVELRAKGTLAGNAVLCDTVTFEGALNYEGCRLMPSGTQGVITSRRSMVLPGNVFIETEAADGHCGRLYVEGDLTMKGRNTVTVVHDGMAPGRYVVAECTGTLSVDVSQLGSRGLEGCNFDYVVEGRQLLIVVNDQREAQTDVVWTGSESGVWNYKDANFSVEGRPTSFVTDDQVVFNSEGSRTEVTVDEMVVTGGVTFDSGAYTLRGNGGLSGQGTLTVNAEAQVDMQLRRSNYTGATIVNGGSLTVTSIYDGGTPSSIGASTADEGNLQLNGGLLAIADGNVATNHIVTLTDTARISVPQKSSISFKGGVRGTGWLVKEGPGQLNFTNGGENPFAGLIMRQGTVAQGAWNASFGRVGGPMRLEGGTVSLLDVNNSSTRPVFNYVTTVPEGSAATIVGTTRGAVNGTFLGTGQVTIVSTGVRSDVGADFSQFEGTLVARGSNFRLMSNVKDMKKTRLVLDAAAYVSHYKSNSGTQEAVSTSIGSLSSAPTATDCVLGHGSDTYLVGYNNEDCTYYGLLKAVTVAKQGTGMLTLRTAGSTSRINVNEGTLQVQNSVATDEPITSGAISMASGTRLQGTGCISTTNVRRGAVLTAGNNGATGTLRSMNKVTMASGSTLLVKVRRLPATGALVNDKFRFNGATSHSGDTILVDLGPGCDLGEGDELTIFNGTGTHTGRYVFKVTGEDGKYEFDHSDLLTTGKIRVKVNTATSVTFSDTTERTDVYSADGLLLRRNVPAGEALRGLPSGVYVVGDRKVVVR